MDTPATPDIQLRVLDDSPESIAATREIFHEYQRSLGVDLCFQGFEAELATLPGDYSAPSGCLLLAANACEMKRLYVRPAFRRFGLGRSLAEALLTEAQRAGHSVVLLDTLDDMEAARELYATLGFEDIPPYYFNPIPGAHYLKAELG